MKHIKETKPETQRLVERQMRNWELQRAQHHAEAPAQRAGVADFICISRDVGAGGTGLGLTLAERLGWPVFDRDILHTMAGDDSVREQI